MPNLNEKLIEASKTGNLALVKQLIAEGADPNTSGGRPLQESASKGHLNVMKALVRSGARIDEHSEYGNPALTWAATGKQVESLKWLLSKGADIHATNSSALILSVANNSALSVFYLLENAQFSQDALNSALLWATERDNVVIAKKLVIHGAHIYSRHIKAAKTYNALEVQAFFSSINEAQKNIIEGTLRFIFDTITELRLPEALKALQLITAAILLDEDIRWLEEREILSCVQQVREILLHPFPQNRSTNYPYFGEPTDPTMVVYKDPQGKPAYEKKGLLSLTALNDENTSVTKEATLDFICHLVEKEIESMPFLVEIR